MLGYCGINCQSCPAYQGTINNDKRLLEKAAGSFWNGEYSAKDWVCLGCTSSNQQILGKFCAECKIRNCAIKKAVSNCAACMDFDSCQQIHDFIDGESEKLAETMKLLHERFMDSKR